MHPSVLDVGLYGVSLEVVGRVWCLLWHHVHMRLQKHALTVLIARCGRLTHDDVAGGVLEGLYANSLGKVEKKLLDLLHMTAWAGYLCEVVKVTPDSGRL